MEGTKQTDLDTRHGRHLKENDRTKPEACGEEDLQVVRLFDRGVPHWGVFREIALLAADGMERPTNQRDPCQQEQCLGHACIVECGGHQ